MQAKDKKKFSEIMYGLADNFQVELSKPGLKMRFESLKQFSIQEVEKAAVAILHTHTFYKMPTIADFLKAIPGQQQISVQSKAQIEADKIIAWLNQYGGSKAPKFTDPIAKHLMSHRWPYRKWASEVLESELKWWVKEFCAAYESYNELGNAAQIETTKEILKLTEGIG